MRSLPSGCTIDVVDVEHSPMTVDSCLPTYDDTKHNEGGIGGVLSMEIFQLSTQLKLAELLLQRRWEIIPTQDVHISWIY